MAKLTVYLSVGISIFFHIFWNKKKSLLLLLVFNALETGSDLWVLQLSSEYRDDSQSTKYSGWHMISVLKCFFF